MCVCVRGGEDWESDSAERDGPMALNPHLSGSEPVVGSEELFLIRRDRVKFRVSEMSKPSKIGVFKGVGSLYLTTESMFFVADAPKAQGPHN